MSKPCIKELIDELIKLRKNEIEILEAISGELDSEDMDNSDDLK